MNGIAAASHFSSAAAYLVFSVLLLTSWRGRLQGALLVVAALVTALWSLAAAFSVWMNTPPLYVAAALEVARDFAWFLFLVRLIERPEKTAGAIWGFRAGATLVTVLTLGMLAVTLVFPNAGSGESAQTGMLLFGFVALAVTGLVLIEQLYRNTLPEKRWTIKYLCLGIGVIFTYDFFLYAHALLFKQVDPALWMARGFVNAAVVPLIAVAAARNPQWSLDVFVSRGVVFHTTALLAAGLYLLVMAAGGYVIRYYGGQWGPAMRDLFLAGAMVVLLILMFSEQIRARLRVFINKHFFNYKYDYRLEWLRIIRTLSAHDQHANPYERALRALADIVESTAGTLWQRQGERWFVPMHAFGLTPAGQPGEPADGSLVRFLTERNWVINLDDYSPESSVYKDLELPGWLRDRPEAWLIVPLMLQTRLFGFIVLGPSRAPRDINWEDTDLLKTAGRQIAIHLAQVESAKALSESRQFEAFNRFSAYVVHDLKNLVAQLSLVAANAERHRNNPEFMHDAIATVENSVARMNKLLAQLRNGPRPGVAGAVALGPLLRQAVQLKGQGLPRPQVELCDGTITVEAEADKLVTVIGHMVQNAQEATPDDGRIYVRLKAGEGCAVIEIEDTGHGMDEAFVQQRLFRPFDSTKGLTGMGIGMHEAKEYVQSLGGTIEVHSRPGEGTLFRVRLPLAEAGVRTQASQAAAGGGH